MGQNKWLVFLTLEVRYPLKHKIIFIFTLLITILFFIPSNSIHYTIDFDLKVSPSKEKNICQLFYTDQNNYTATLSQNIACDFKENKMQHVTLKVYAKKVYPKIRFDLPEGDYQATIKNLSLSFLFIKQTIIFDNIETLQNTMHNMKILKYSQSSITIQSDGGDPFINLSHHANIDNYDILLIIHTVLIFLLIYVLLFLLQELSTENFLMLLLFTYTFYTVFGMYDIRFHYILPLLTLYIAIIHKYLFIPFIKEIALFATLYLGWAAMTMILPVPLANSYYLYETFPLILGSIVLLIGVYKQHFNAHFFKKYLTALLVLLAIIMMLIHEGYLNNRDTLFGYFTFYTGPWLQKNYMFWYVLLTFGTLSFYDIKKKKDFLFIFAILILSYFALYHGYSKSAMLAFISSTIVYLLLSFIKFKKNHLLLLIWIMTFYIIFSPILFSLIDLSSYHPRLVHRNTVYHTSAALISQHWVIGYGYGSTMLIDIRNFLPPETVAHLKEIVFRGGHPHNLSLLFWLEFGIIGAIFLAYYIHKLLLVMINNTYNTAKLAALLAMFVALDIISAFSWSIWYPKVLHTFTFFGVLLIISLNSQFAQKHQSS